MLGLFASLLNSLFGGAAPASTAKTQAPAKTTASVPAFTFNQQAYTAAYDVQEKARFVTAVEEGRHTRMYKDSRGFRTIGIGFNMQASSARTLWKRAGVKTSFDSAYSGRAAITEAEVDALFSLTFNEAQTGAQRAFDGYASLGVWQKVALIGMVFQLGEGGVRGFTGTLGALARKDSSRVYSGVLSSLWARQTPARAKRAALMLAYNISHEAAEERLVAAGQIKANERKYA